MSFDNRYNWSDRLLHRLAFATGGLQLSLADLEDYIFKKKYNDIDISRPVFITALPRAGTTLLLNLLANTGEFASHIYRDMPFVKCPILWNRFSRLVQVDDQVRERAHGDGVGISVDSPEAFEEVIWKQFWPDHYNHDRIEPWRKCNDKEFLNFISNHTQKIISLRSKTMNLRYISKNNTNIARLNCLPSIFDQTKVIIPFRNPLHHALSLHRQHLRFSELHKKDKFAKEYMKGVGHYDFGGNLLPINFSNWIENSIYSNPSKLEFWLEYWISAYNDIYNSVNDEIKLLSFKSLTVNPEKTLSWLSRELELNNPLRLLEQAPSIRNPNNFTVDIQKLPLDLVERAISLNDQMELVFKSYIN